MSALIFIGIILATYFLLGYVVKVALLVADEKLIDGACFGRGGGGLVSTLWPLAIVVFIISFFEEYDFERLGNKNPKKLSAEAVAKRIVDGKQRVVLVEGKDESD